MPRILVVEDEKSILELVRYNLEREGFSVITALDGVQGLALARSQTPDLIVLDVMLPGMNGLDVCRELRHSEQTENLPIVMLSARADELDRVLGLEMGADDYVTKPFSTRDLISRIKARLCSESASKEKKAEGPGRCQLDPGSGTFDKEREV
ncbi:MAG: Alkaline phosphatase synthesis transcriptional regulatory protein PhoP [Pelotomaculum sp. PtaB.Bin104]|nr:MAG: Alkaline phosphatase synthesis transcriptional regulatory protein PhoP [Pelotomaculum sp. PtaB.Bin104]